MMILVYWDGRGRDFRIWGSWNVGSKYGIYKYLGIEGFGDFAFWGFGHRGIEELED